MGRRLTGILLRQTTRTGGFFTICFVNMLLNFRWSIPAWLLLAAHVLWGVPPLWVFFVALSLWPLAAILLTAIVRLLSRVASLPMGNPSYSGSNVVKVDADTPNKNPYSATRQSEEDVKASYGRSYEGKDWCAESDPPTQLRSSEASSVPDGAPSPVTLENKAGTPLTAEGKDWYAEYMQSEQYKRETRPSSESDRKSEL